MGAVFSIYAGFYYWSPKFFGTQYDERLASAHLRLGNQGFVVAYLAVQGSVVA
jgi:heme/copper-type cytochrome/quinol oxidase subunit 1